MNNKEIAKYAFSFIGGTPKVHRYYNESENKSIDLMYCTETQYTNTNVFSTIGLANYDAGIVSDGKSVRVELIGIANSELDDWGNVMASIAFEVMDSKTLCYGMVFQNVVREYIEDSILEHVVLVSPVYWDTYAPLMDDNISVLWLLVLPISEGERQYIEKYGIDSFESLLANGDFDILNLRRNSFVDNTMEEDTIINGVTNLNDSIEHAYNNISENNMQSEYHKLK